MSGSGASPLLLLFCIFIFAINFAEGLKDLDWQSKSKFKNKFDKFGEEIKEKIRNLLSRAPKEDIEHIELDENGAPYFVDTFTFEAGTKTQKRDIELLMESEQTLNAFTLHSCPSCLSKIYIDFTGESVTGSAWSSGTLVGAPFTCDADTATFTQWEHKVIQDIWARVAEDYKPFVVDVTTEAPAGAATSWPKTTLHAVVTFAVSTLPSYTAGGVGYVGIFNKSNTYTYRPAWVYYNRLGGANDTRMIAAAISHEIGHNFGLSHDGTAAAAYYTGHGSGATSWGPLMGSSSKTLTQWSKGEYTGANNQEDDMLIISRQVGYATATPTFTAGTQAGCNAYFTGSSVITNANAVDTWNLVLSPPALSSASISITATPWISAFKPSDVSFNGNNLDISLTYGSVTNAPLGSSSAALTATNVATSSQIKVRGSGETSASTSFSTYGSVGWYQLAVCVTYSAALTCTSGACCNTATGLVMPSGVVCNAESGPCEAPGVCNGVLTTCPAKSLYPSTQVCRAAAGGCDKAEYCSGTSVSCPADTFLAGGTVCRASVGVCDQAETCSGTTSACPADTVLPSSTVCRASAGPCDVIDYCSGSSGTCGPDYISVGATCRQSTGPCDPAEKCNGSGVTCPADGLLASGTTCKKTTGANGVCNGSSGTCN